MTMSILTVNQNIICSAILCVCVTLSVLLIAIICEAIISLSVVVHSQPTENFVGHKILINIQDWYVWEGSTSATTTNMALDTSCKALRHCLSFLQSGVEAYQL